MRLIDAHKLTDHLQMVQKRDGLWGAIDRVVMEVIDRFVREEPTVDAASPWHRVEDELPEPIHPTDPRYKAYLICDSLGYMHVADYTYSKHFPTCYSFHVNGEEETDVKYWMPIEPPKEDADGK